MEHKNRTARGQRLSTKFDGEALDPHSGYTYADCNGSLMIGKDNFRFWVGHAWTGSSKVADTIGAGSLHLRYTQASDEAEHAISVLGKRLSQNTFEADELGGD